MRVNSLNCPSSARPNGGCICHSTLFGHGIFMIFQPDYAYRLLFYCSHNSIPCCEVNYITGFMHTNPDVQCYCTVCAACDPIPILAHAQMETSQRQITRLHLDDLRKFSGDADSGRDCASSVADTSSAPARCSSNHKERGLPNERVCPRWNVEHERGRVFGGGRGTM